MKNTYQYIFTFLIVLILSHSVLLFSSDNTISIKDGDHIVEGFEDTTFPPFGWENPGDHWARFTTEAYEGEGYARCSWYHNADAILISPRLVIDGADSINFFWRNDNLYEAKASDVITGDTLWIEISNTYLDPDPTWECIGTLSADAPMTTYEEVSFSIPDSYIGNDAKIRWRHRSEVNNESRGVGLDNITMPVPYIPLNFSVEPSFISDHIGPGGFLDFQYEITNLGIQQDRYSLTIEYYHIHHYNPEEYEGFEIDDGDWTATSDWDPVGDWAWTNEYDVNNYTGANNPPPTAHSGTGLWATVPNGDYTNSGGYSYVSKTVDFDDVEAPYMTFWYWSDINGAWDYCDVSVNGDILLTIDTYPGTEWEYVELDLSAYVGLSDVEINFMFYATTIASRAGLYIDDIEISESSPGYPWPISLSWPYVDLDPGETGYFSLNVFLSAYTELDYAQLIPVTITSREDSTLKQQVLSLATCHPRDPYEPNDRMSDATPGDYDFISDGAQIYYDPYYKDKDLDIYKINCLEGDIISCSFELPPDETEFDGAIKLVDADSTELAYADAFEGGENEYLEYRILEDGTYYWILGKWDEILEDNVSRKTQIRGENTTYYTVTFDHILPPEIEIDPPSLYFGIIYQSGDTAQIELNISNTAADPQASNLEWDIDIQNADSLIILSTYPDSGSVTPGLTRTVTVTCYGDPQLTPGMYTADLVVHNNALLYGASDITIPLTLNINNEAMGLMGNVTYNNDPLENVMVKAGNFITYTDVYGYYSFDSIVAGTYDILFYKEWFDPYWVYDVMLDENWVLIIDVGLFFNGPPPENLTATGWNGCIYLDWDPPQTGGGGGGTQVDYVLDDGTYENGWAINPGYEAWLGNQFPTTDGGEIVRFEVYGDENVAASNEAVTIDVYDSEKIYVGSTDAFVIPSNDWITVPAPHIPFLGEFYAMIHWDDLPTSTNYVGFDENGPNANSGYDWYLSGGTWQLLHVAAASDPGVFAIRATAMVRGKNIELAYDTYQLGKEPEVKFRSLDNSAFVTGQRVSENVFAQSGHSIDTGSREVSHYTFNEDKELSFKLPKDITLHGYNLYELNKGFIAYIEGQHNTNGIDEFVAFGTEYTYWVTAVYNLGESVPSNTATATPLPPYGIGYHETFDSNWATTGWTTLGSPNNWLWSAGYAYLYWSPAVLDYDMSLISPMIELPNDPSEIFDLTVSMYIDDYSSDSGEIMEIWVIHDTGEDMIFEWDLDDHDDWGVSGGTNWTYDNMPQYAGQTVQLKFRSHGGSTYNFNYWYIYDVLLEYMGVIPDYGALEGTVTDYDGNPIQNVRVSIGDGSVYTDENGYYFTGPVEVGIWNVQFYHEDYTELIYYDVEICEDQTTVLDAMLGNPTMEITPDSLYVELPPYSSTTRTLTLTNNGTVYLDWYISYWDKTNTLYEPDKSKTKTNSPNVYAESDPDAEAYDPPSSDEIWDIMFSYDVDTPTGGTGIAGAEFGNGYFLVSEWGYSSKNVFKLDYNGTCVGSWEPTWMPGTDGIRDMAFDGEYFYGSNASTTIYQFDEDGNLIGTIPSPVAVRSIAYDEIHDAFWVNNWDADLKLIDRSGSVLNTILSPPSMYGSAWDNVTPGGPYLWIFTGITTGAGCQIEQYDLNTLMLTGVIHSVDADFGIGSYISGGLFTSGEIVPGTYILGGLTQGTPDILFGYELCQDQYPPHVIFNPEYGTESPFGGTGSIEVSFYSYDDTPGTVHTGQVIFRSDQNVPPVSVSICLKIIYPTPDYGTLTGTVSDYSGNPIEGAQVHVYYYENHYFTYTDSTGFYTVQISPGDYYVEISAEGYNTYTTPDYITIIPFEVTTLNVSLTAPIMVVDPDSIYVALLPGESTIESLTIGNIGNGPVDFELQIYTNDKTETDYSRFTCNDELLVLKNDPITGTSTFTATQDRDDIIIQYQNGYDNNGIGTGGVFSAIAAARFTSEELNSYYDSYNIEQVNIHIRSADFTLVELKVWEGGSYGDPGTEVYSQDITDNIVIEDWTTITLTTPIQLVSGNEYWIGYAIDATADHPCSVDAGPAVLGKGDWMYYSGSWVEISTAYSLDYNWCIQGVISPQGPPWIPPPYPITGTIPAGGDIDIAIPISAVNLNPGDIKTADIVISTNPDVGTVTIPVTLVVGGYSQNELPDIETSLHPNFPNPVLNNTTFEFSLKKRSHVTLSVYNLKGQLVATLLDEELDPSALHCIEWDGTANGKKLANGIYFYKLETGKKSFLKKMVLMR